MTIASLSLLGLDALIASLITAVVSIAIAIPAGIFLSTFLNKKKHAKSETKATNILQNAYAEAKNIKKEALIDAKDEVLRLKNECDADIKERRAELTKTETRINQREDFLNQREISIEAKSEAVEKAKQDLVKKENEITEAIKEQKEATEKIVKELEKISKLSKEEAKKQLVEMYVDDAKKDAAVMIKKLEQEAKEEADKKARNIITLSIQKYAADHTSEITVSSVPLPNDEMKGRIIGREGRNIRAIEQATGCDLIIDDTPEAVVLSSFDPIRREVARLSLEKLISDGRIHPTRIEEMVEKVRKDLDVTIKDAGEAAAFEAGVHGLHPELIKLLGRLKYRTSYGQNVLKHSLEVSFLAGLMATELGANVNIAKRGGLLHDIGKSVDHEVEGTHISIGVDNASKFKESKEVIHCIAAHHGDVPYESVEACLVQAADAISSARPGARRESMENYVKRLQKLEEIANGFKGVDKSFAIQAGREVRIIVKPTEVSDEQALFIAKDIAAKIEKEMEYPGTIKVNVIRETRSVEYAK